MPPNSCEVGIGVRVFDSRARVFFYGQTANCTLHIDQMPNMTEILSSFNLGVLLKRHRWAGWRGVVVESANMCFNVSPEHHVAVWRGIFLPQINYVL